MKKRRRQGCACCGAGCLGALAGLLALAGIWYSGTGRYQPNLPSIPALSANSASDTTSKAGDFGLRNFVYNEQGKQSPRYYRRVPQMLPPTLPPGAPPLFP